MRSDTCSYWLNQAKNAIQNATYTLTAGGSIDRELQDIIRRLRQIDQEQKGIVR